MTCNCKITIYLNSLDNLIIQEEVKLMNSHDLQVSIMTAGLVVLFLGCSVSHTSAVNTPPPTGPTPTITLTPKSSQVAPGGRISFFADVQNTPGANSDCRLNVEEGSAGGAFDSITGEYVAPWVSGTYHVTATSYAVSGLTDHAVVTVATSGSLVGPSQSVLPRHRAGHNATLLHDGRIFISGGSVPDLISYFNTTLIYTPAGNGGFGSLATGPTLNQVRYGAASVCLKDGRVLICGGDDQSSRITAELFDPATGQCVPTGNMIYPRVGHRAILLDNGMVLIADGYRTKWLELFDPAQGKFILGPSMPTDRAGMVVTKLKNGDVLLAGGYAGTFPLLAETLIFSTSTRSLTAGPSLSVGRNGGQATLFPDGRVLISGGVLMTDPVNRTVTTEIGTVDSAGSLSGFAPGPSFKEAGGPSQAISPLADGRFLITGAGRNGTGARRDTLIFNPATNAFSSGPTLALPRHEHTATTLPNGTVILIGGYGTYISTANTIEIYYP